MVCFKMGGTHIQRRLCKTNRVFISVLFTTVLFISAVVSNAATLVVPAGGSLQAAINSAQPGDVIVLQAGAAYAPVTLPNKGGSTDITIRSSRSDELVQGARVTPAHASLMAKITATQVEAALATAAGAHHYNFIGIEFSTTANNNYSILRLGASEQTSLDHVPHHLTFDRCYIHGQPTLNVQAAITLNSAHTTISNSYISEIHWTGIQSYGVGSFNGPGPFTITNNYIEAAGLNVIFGGATPAIQNLVPSDITITGNHLHKPLAWKGVWTTVNLLELKSARRAVIADNLMENNWPDAQIGWAVIFNTFRDGGWEVVEDVQFLRNTIRNTTNGINLAGMDSRDMVLRMRRITVADNRLEGLGFGGVEAKPFQVLNASEDVTIDHNTVTSSTHSLTLDSVPGYSHVRLKFTNNLVPHNLYGVFSNGGAVGMDAMAARAADWRMEKNAIILTPVDLQPKYPINYFPSSAAGAGGLLGTDNQPVGARTGGSTPPPTPTPTVTPTPAPTPTSTPNPTPTPTSTPAPGSSRFINGYVKIGDEYFNGNSTVTLSVSGQVVQSYSSQPGGYFEFSSGPIGSTLTATSPGYSFQRVTIDTGSPYFIIGGTASSGPTPTPTPTPIPTPTPAPTQAPMTVNMTSPTSDSTFSMGTSVTFTASASHRPGGTVSTVAFQANSQNIGTATIAPYTVVSSSLPSGVYSVTAVARDNLGATVTSSPITVKISKALRGVRNNRKNAGDTTASLQANQIDFLVADIEQTYLDFYAEKSMFQSARQIDKYLLAALFLARSSASLADKSQNNAVADRMSKLDAYLSFCEDLMTQNAISAASRAASNLVHANADLVITQPNTRPSSGSGFLSRNGIATISNTSSIPFALQTLSGNSYELGEVSVTIKGQAALVRSVSPSSITFTVPGDINGGLADIVVTCREGYIAFSTAVVSGLNPVIFVQAGNAGGSGAILNALNIHSNTFGTVTPAQYLGLDSRTRLSIMATGISTGVSNTDPGNDIFLETGQTLANLAESVAVEARTSSGTVRLPVEFAGWHGGLAGMDQVNVLLPPSLAGAGSVQLTVVIGSVRSNSVTVIVQ